MSYIVFDCFAMDLFVFFFPFFPIVSETVDDALVIDCFTVEDPSFAAKQPGKQNPLEHAYITYSFSLLLALDFATAFV